MLGAVRGERHAERSIAERRRPDIALIVPPGHAARDKVQGRTEAATPMAAAREPRRSPGHDTA